MIRKAGAQPGNKHAVGNQGGRPCKFDKALEFAELEKWSKTEDALVFRMFPLIRGYSHDTMTNWAYENDEFLDIYNRSKELVGVRRELRLIKTDSATPFQRYATYYDKKLHAHERDEKVFDSNLKKSEVDQMNSTAPSMIDLENMKMENQALREAIAKLTKANDTSNVS